MMAVNREKRYQSMDAVVAAINRPSIASRMRLIMTVTLGAVIFLLLGILLQRLTLLVP
jgi:hypothetical protein